jgi:molecular chaperone HscA
MALLQITEPGMSAEPHKHRLAVGIDLGTTNSLVATVRNGIAICLPDETGRTMLPSAVRYHADGVIDVGLGALKAQAIDPRNTVVVGQTLHGPRPEGHRPSSSRMPYDFEDSGRDGAFAHCAGRVEKSGRGFGGYSAPLLRAAGRSHRSVVRSSAP